jgi:hypothetical protein
MQPTPDGLLDPWRRCGLYQPTIAEMALMTERFQNCSSEQDTPLDADTARPTDSDMRCGTPDWPLIEQDYRVAGLSLRQMAAKHGCHHSSIANRASRHGWTRSK